MNNAEKTDAKRFRCDRNLFFCMEWSVFFSGVGFDVICRFARSMQDNSFGAMTC
jgi:hypothetical protein